jgi:hypothetical protein
MAIDLHLIVTDISLVMTDLLYQFGLIIYSAQSRVLIYFMLTFTARSADRKLAIRFWQTDRTPDLCPDFSYRDRPKVDVICHDYAATYSIVTDPAEICHPRFFTRNDA